jgi:hypothetical protein
MKDLEELFELQVIIILLIYWGYFWYKLLH